MYTYTGTITVTDKAIFTGSVVNAGTINGNAQFNDNSVNDAQGVVTGTASFGPCARNGASYEGAPGSTLNGYRVTCPWFRHWFDPPVRGIWVTSSNSSGASVRKMVIIGSRNSDALFAAFQSTLTFDAGPWQICPEPSCFAYPDLYKPLSNVNFVPDYELQQNYLDEPGNPMGAGNTPPGTAFHFKETANWGWYYKRNWFLDENFARAADLVPNGANVVIHGRMRQNYGSYEGGPVSVNDLTMYYRGGSSSSLEAGTFNVAGLATFTSSINVYATINGNALFLDNSSLNGVLTGNATFSDASENREVINGDASFFDNSANRGTVNGNATFFDNAINTGTVTGTITYA